MIVSRLFLIAKKKDVITGILQVCLSRKLIFGFLALRRSFFKLIERRSDLFPGDYRTLCRRVA
jgi:hypothetical protein